VLSIQTFQVASLNLTTGGWSSPFAFPEGLSAEDTLLWQMEDTFMASTAEKLAFHSAFINRSWA